MTFLAQYRKAIAALFGAIATAVVTSFPSSQQAQLAAGVLGALATALLTAAVPKNLEPGDVTDEADAGMTAVEALVVGLVLILLAGLIFGVGHR